jgi:hypothetical protein
VILAVVKKFHGRRQCGGFYHEIMTVWYCHIAPVKIIFNERLPPKSGV